MKNEAARLNHEKNRENERIKDNLEKIKVNCQLPYLVGNVVEVRHSSFSSVLVDASSYWTLRKKKKKKTELMSILTRSVKERLLLLKPLRVRQAEKTQ